MIRNFVLTTLVLLFASLSQAQPATNPQFNLRIHPLYILIDGFGADLEFVGGANWSVGPSIAFYGKDKGSSFESRASVIGVRGTYTINDDRFTDGWYAGPFAGFASVEVEKTDSLGTAGKGSENGLVLGSFGGYQWMWNSFSVNAGAGYSLTSVGDVTVDYIASGQQEKVDSETVGGLVWEVGLSYSW